MSRHRSHPLDPGTHTIEMAQIAELDARLREVGGVPAAELGLPGLTGGAVVASLGWTGAPTFPDIHALVTGGSGPGPAQVVLHTPALRVLSRRLGLRHVWGVGPEH